uniref:pentapeptide repeat-containing protein n=1 Tax=Methanosarcina vacuolata TaxID=2215 RepID=UPI00373AF5D0
MFSLGFNESDCSSYLAFDIFSFSCQLTLSFFQNNGIWCGNRNSRFGNCRFGNSRFGNCRFGNCRFGNCRFGNCRFGNCRFGNCSFFFSLCHSSYSAGIRIYGFIFKFS